MRNYKGKVGAYPTAFVEPDIGDDENASSINVALEALADRTVSIGNPGFRIAKFTANGTWRVPARVDTIEVFLCGGGGAGGKGAPGIASSNTLACGGGGGAGASYVKRACSVTPGDLLTITIGAGGTGYTAVGVAPGNPGGDTTLTHGATVLARGPGGGGGTSTNYQKSPGDPNFGVCAGGVPSKGAFRPLALSVSDPRVVYGFCAGSAGEGVDSYGSPTQTPRPGLRSCTAYAGGSPGALGSTSGTHFGGGAGGGGGAGPFGVGANGGTGGAGRSSGFGLPGSPGASAGPNTGAGGGGGGAGGCGPSGGDAGGDGGAGGSGYLMIVWVGES